MALVLAQNDVSESGIVYDDTTGVSYQFPKMYLGIVRPGSPFVYYRGRKRKAGRQQQVYFGTGIIGTVKPDATAAGRMKCEILNFLPFEAPVPFKQGNSNYLEIGGTRRGYFQRGVRVISNEEYEAILKNAGLITENLGVTVSNDEAEQRSVLRMTKMTLQTTEFANGQKILRKVKNKELTLHPEQLSQHLLMLIEKQKGKCAITGAPLQFDGKCDDIEFLCSLDRIDSNKHYSKENLQVVCRFVNRWKGSDNDEEFRRLISAVRSNPKLPGD